MHPLFGSFIHLVHFVESDWDHILKDPQQFERRRISLRVTTLFPRAIICIIMKVIQLVAAVLWSSLAYASPFPRTDDSPPFTFTIELTSVNDAKSGPIIIPNQHGEVRISK
jgi:hypothetical protein